MNLFEKLRTREVEISSLLAQVLRSADEEVRSVALLHEAVQQLPMDHALLDVQAAFCKSKGRGDLALECAKRSVTAAPGEFGPWARLAEIYVFLEEWELALLTLNSCPMFTHYDKDAPRTPEPTSRVMLPLLYDSTLDEINDDVPAGGELIQPNPRKLVGATYKGTFLKAYSLLTEIAAKIGWDQLLRIRSHVFVMEEEYRQGGSSQQAAKSRNSSTTALKGPSNVTVNGAATDGSEEEAEQTADRESQEAGPTASKTSIDSNTIAASEELKADEIEKPEHTVPSEVVKGGGEDVRRTQLSSGFLLTFISRMHPTRSLRSFRISVSVSAGSTILSWCSTKTYGSIPSGALKWCNTGKEVSSIRSQLRNGRFWVSLQSVCTTPSRPLKHTRRA